MFTQERFEAAKHKVSFSRPVYHFSRWRHVNIKRGTLDTGLEKWIGPGVKVAVGMEGEAI